MTHFRRERGRNLELHSGEADVPSASAMVTGETPSTTNALARRRGVSSERLRGRTGSDDSRPDVNGSLSAGDPRRRKPRLREIFAGEASWRVVAGLVGLGALLVSAIPLAADVISDHTGPPLTITVTGSNAAIGDHSEATNATLNSTTVRAIDPLSGATADSAVDREIVKVGVQDIELVVESHRPYSQVITGVRAQVIAAKPPIDGTLLSVGDGASGNSGGVLSLGIDLASDDLNVSELSHDHPTEPYFAHSSQPLVEGTPVVIDIVAFPGRYLYDWELEVDLVENGVLTHLMVRTDGGKPFVVTGYARNYKSIYSYTGANEWRDQRSLPFCRPACLKASSD